MKSIRFPALVADDTIRAIQADIKTATRLVAFPANDLRPFPLKDNPDGWWFRCRVYRSWDSVMRDPQGVMSFCKYHPGDILYVKEAFFEHRCHCYYRADEKHKALEKLGIRFMWHPSTNMPKEAARIFLRVTDVRVERLQEVDDDGVLAEGLKIGDPFDEVWDSAIKPKDRAIYGWDANPWVWVIKFERISRAEAKGLA